ncbi:MAG TPA: tetratricopeptide repeat protein [Allosphingosinicella sp.]|jgi:Flp pilus assembly protein TadD|nr:tetratricopeptide repeat protein [Allosphingosinicella sp.]
MNRGLLLLATGSALTTGALAQDRTGLPPGAVVQPLDQSGGAGAELRRNLTALALNPRSVTALNGAGRAALELGDADAALSFFARASEAEPRNPRARAGMAQALVHLERAGDAMPLFSEAIALGAPETEIAADRGLAWDSLGQPARAQADYALSLRREDDPEVRRRMALSLAISGRRDEALSIIGGQIRNRDRAALRTQAFILALTGDAAGADRTARDSMPAGADALAPYLGRLASLSPQQKALAVHFGHFPSDGRAVGYAQADTAADPGALALAQGTAPMGGPPPFDTGAGRRRPGDSGPPLASQIRRPSTPVQAQSRRTVQIAELQTRRAQQRPAPGGPAPAWAEPVLDEGQPQSRSQPQRRPPSEAPAWADPVLDERQSPGFTLVPQGRPLGTPTPQPEPEAPAQDFSSVTAFVNSLPADDEVAPPVEVARPVRSAPARTRTATARPTPTPTRASRTRAPANPSRVWVQLAIGDRAALVYQFGAFRRQAPALLGGRAAYMSPLNATNRLLVGPFASDAAARAFVSQLARSNVQAYPWTSEAGQEIDALQGANDSRTPTRTAQETRQPASSRSARGRAGREQPAATTSRSGRSSRSAQRQQQPAATSSRSGRSTQQQPAAGTRSGRAARAQAAAVVAKKDPPAPARASRGRSAQQQGTTTRRRRSN